MEANSRKSYGKQSTKVNGKWVPIPDLEEDPLKPVDSIDIRIFILYKNRNKRSKIRLKQLRKLFVNDVMQDSKMSFETNRNTWHWKVMETM